MSESISPQELENMNPPKTPNSVQEVEGSIANIEENIQNIVIHQVDQIVGESFSGPLPHPSILEKYDNVLPGTAERIVQMAEKEQQHRHNIENAKNKTDSRDSFLGIMFAGTIILSCLGIAYFIATEVNGVRGTLLSGFFGVGGICSVIISMLNNTRTSWKKDEK